MEIDLSLTAGFLLVRRGARWVFGCSARRPRLIRICVQASKRFVAECDPRQPPIRLKLPPPSSRWVAGGHLTLIGGFWGSHTTPPNQKIPDKKSTCEEMMRMAQGTLWDDKNAISSHLPSVRGDFSGKLVTDGNPSTLLCPNPSQMTNAHIMQQCRTQCNVVFFDLVHRNDHPISCNHCNHIGSPICPPQMCH